MKTVVPSQIAIDLHGLIWGDITHIFTDVPMSNEIAEGLSNSIWNRIKKILKEHNKEIKEDAITEIMKQLTKYLKDGDIDFMSINLEGIEQRLREALK